MRLSELRARLDSGEIDAVGLTQEYLKRIHEHDKALGSYITVCERSALREAEAAQSAIRAGRSKPLSGIPLSVKDNICTEGVRTTCASEMLSDFVPAYDATAVKRLRDEGFVMLGKTNMDEFGMGGSSQTSCFGGVRNPYDTRRVAGGSSGGAAAAVAAGLCAAALGTDTGGSVRQPAAFCGVTGLKPTYGTVSRFGLIAFASSLDQIGVIARCAEDAGYVLSSICGCDRNDATASRLARGNYTQLVGSDISGLRIGLPREFFKGCRDEVSAAVMRAADYYRSIGCELADCSLPSLEYAVSAYYLISSAEAAANLSRFDGIKYGHRGEGDDCAGLIKHSRREGFGTEVKRRIMLGNYALSSGYYEEYYNRARRIQAKLRAEYEEIFDKCDVILTPTAPSAAYAIGSRESDPVEMYLSDICTVTASIAGLPAISSVCGYDADGMPIGMSLTGRAFDEKTIIAVCDRFERDFERKENSFAGGGLI